MERQHAVGISDQIHRPGAVPVADFRFLLGKGIFRFGTGPVEKDSLIRLISGDDCNLCFALFRQLHLKFPYMTAIQDSKKAAVCVDFHMRQAGYDFQTDSPFWTQIKPLLGDMYKRFF